VFKLFKNKQTKPTDRFTETVQLTRRLIESQISIAEGKSAHKKIFDVHVCAYIFGFAHAMLAKAGVEDEMETKLLIAQTFMQIFGNDPGSKAVGQCLRMQLDDQFVRARQLGDSEAMEWLASSGNDVPTGLTDYLNASR
jgi:hypothetical protein